MCKHGKQTESIPKNAKKERKNKNKHINGTLREKGTTHLGLRIAGFDFFFYFKRISTAFLTTNRIRKFKLIPNGFAINLFI